MDSEHKQVLENQVSIAREAIADESWGYALAQMEAACRIIERNTDESRQNG
jgi:hypothetical protein